MEKIRKAIRNAPFPPHIRKTFAFGDTESILRPHRALEDYRKTQPSLLHINHAASCVAPKRELPEEEPVVRRSGKVRRVAEEQAELANEAAAAAADEVPVGEPRAEIAASLYYKEYI